MFLAGDCIRDFLDVRMGDCRRMTDQAAMPNQHTWIFAYAYSNTNLQQIAFSTCRQGGRPERPGLYRLVGYC